MGSLINAPLYPNTSAVEPHCFQASCIWRNGRLLLCKLVKPRVLFRRRGYAAGCREKEFLAFGAPPERFSAYLPGLRRRGSARLGRACWGRRTVRNRRSIGAPGGRWAARSAGKSLFSCEGDCLGCFHIARLVQAEVAHRVCARGVDGKRCGIGQAGTGGHRSAGSAIHRVIDLGDSRSGSIRGSGIGGAESHRNGGYIPAMEVECAGMGDFRYRRYGVIADGTVELVSRSSSLVIPAAAMGRVCGGPIAVGHGGRPLSVQC